MIPAGFIQTEFGMIPKSWHVSKIRDFAVVEGGYAFSSSKFEPHGTFQVVKMSNLYGGALNLDRSESYLSNITALERRYLLRKDDILITLTGTTGKRDYGYTFQITCEQNLLLNQRVARIVVAKDSLVHPMFAFFQLKMPFFQNQFFQISKGGTGNQTNVGTIDVAEISIPLPPLPEQRAIAEALSDVDDLINSLDKLIAKKRAIKQATMQQLLTGKTRLPGFSGEWTLMKLGELGSFSKGKGIKKDEVAAHGFPCIRYGEIYTRYHNNVIALQSRIPHSVAVTSQKLEKGDLLFAGSGETAEEIGKCVAYLGDEEAYAGGDIVILSPSRGNSMYLGYLLNHTTVADQKSKLGQGDAVVHISARNLASIVISLPSQDEQNAIADVISAIDYEIKNLTIQRDKVRFLKQGMMQELLTGKTRLV